MKIQILLIAVLLKLSSCSGDNEPLNDERINDYKSLVEEFIDPGIDYRPAPLWVWNNEVSREDIDHSLTELKDKGMGGVFIHPRKGLITEYLSEEWFNLVAYSMKKAQELDLNVWIYDENVCPSGFAGGHVFNEMPESYNQGTALTNRKLKKLDLSAPNGQKVKFVFKREKDAWVNITDEAKTEEGKDGEYMVFYLRNFATGNSSYAGFSYVDLIAQGVTQKFMEVTMTGYENVGKQEFGKLIPGVFTDEPQIGSEGGLRYTPDLFDEFSKRWDYRLEDNLVSLVEMTGNWRKVRHDYRTVLLEMFIDRWSKPWYEYTERNDLIWTGHYWENTWPDIYHGPDNMAMYAWHQMPGIDMLFNSLERRPDQFGNNLAVKELSSIANQFERHRTLSETYGGAGWDLRFEDMKRLGDWQYALGVNFMNQHISQLSLVGYRKQNYPQSFLDYDPYWDLYKYQTDYFSRLSLALSSGRQLNRILVFEPTTSVWMYYGGEGTEKLKEIGDSFKGMIQVLEDYQVEYDIGCENVIKHHGRIMDGKFVINKRAYDLVVIPDMMENIDRASFELLEEYIANGGTVLQLGEDPSLIDGDPSETLDLLLRNENWIVRQLSEELIEEYFIYDDFRMRPSSTGRVHHMRRQLNDGHVIFMANFSLEEEAETEISIKGRSVEGMCLHTGNLFPLSYERKDGKLGFKVKLPPGGSYMVYVHNKKNIPPAPEKGEVDRQILASTETKVEMLHPNVLSIDYADLNLMGEDKGKMFYAEASDIIYKRFGYETGCPWNIVQYKTTFLDQNKEHNDGDRFKLTYYFNLEPGVDLSNMQAVVEQAAYYNISLNGHQLEPGDETWLDPDFNCINIEEAVRTGMNAFSISMDRFDNRCDPSPVYILGNFSLVSARKGWDIVPAKKPGIGSWKVNGSPYYSEKVRYSKTIDCESSGDYEVELPEWNGTVAEILIDGESTGVIQSQPYNKVIRLEEGQHDISVVVYGSLKNVFGPHHVLNRGFMRPPAFRQGKEIMPAGKDYDLFDYGLFDDFKVFKII